MALLFMDSFDHYATADITEKWTQIPTGNGNNYNPTIGAYGRNSSQGLRSDKTLTSSTYLGLGVAITVAPSGDTCIIGTAVRYNGFSDFYTGTGFSENYSSPPYLFYVWNVNEPQFAVRPNTDGTLSVFRVASNGTGTLLGTTSVSLQANVFAYVEVKVKISDSVGTVDVRINGVSALSLTGQDTQGGTSAAWTSVRMGFTSTTTTRYYVDFDDFVLMDGSGSYNNDFIGDVTISVLKPNGAGNSTDWTPSAGSNYQCVDEALVNDDTDYVSSSTLNAKDLYAMEDCAVGADIRAIQVVTAMRKGTEGPGKIKHVVRSNSTDYDSSEMSLGGTAYSFNRTIWETDPATAAQWTESGWNAAQVGVKKTG